MRCAYFDFGEACVERFPFTFFHSASGEGGYQAAPGRTAQLRVRGPAPGPPPPPPPPCRLQTCPGLEVERGGQALGASSGGSGRWGRAGLSCLGLLFLLVGG